MRKLFFSATVLLLFMGCKEQQVEGPQIDNTAGEFNAEELPGRSNLNSKAVLILNDWPEFRALEVGFDALYNVENDEDLILVIEDLVEKQNLLAESDYPEVFDKPQLKSRQKVLKTYILKTKAALEFRTEIKESAIKMVEAYNALRDQFNVMVNNAIDPSLILDE